MIPFARMLQYGNVVTQSKIIDLQAASSHLMLLTSDGDLWSFGYSTSGSMGIGVSIPQESQGWYKSNISNVRTFSTNRLGSTVAATSDGKVLVCGAVNAAKFSTPNISTTNLSWLDVTDHIPQVILDKGIKQVYNHTNYVAIMTFDNIIYSTALTLGDSSTVLERTWRVNVANTIVPEKIVAFEQTSSGIVFMVQDSAGYVYGIGSNSNRLLGSAAGDIYTYTQIGTEPFTDYQVTNGGTFSTGVLASGRSVYSGVLTGSASYNNTLVSSGSLKAGAFAGTGFVITSSAKMTGAYLQNQLPLASTGNTASNAVIIIRNVPNSSVGISNIQNVKFVCGNGGTSSGAKNAYMLYQDADGFSELYGLGTNVGQTAALNQSFIKINLPGSLS